MGRGERQGWTLLGGREVSVLWEEEIVGTYESIRVPCPDCGEVYWAQSKSGPCMMASYDVDKAPNDVIFDVNRHAPFVCEKCGCVFMVELGDLFSAPVPRRVVKCPPGTKGKWE